MTYIGNEPIRRNDSATENTGPEWCHTTDSKISILVELPSETTVAPLPYAAQSFLLDGVGVGARISCIAVGEGEQHAISLFGGIADGLAF